MEGIFVYVPVVHTGTLAFLRQYPGAHIFLLDTVEGKSITPYLERDMRALDAQDVARELRAHGFVSVEVLQSVTLAERLSKYERIIVPYDEIVDLFLTQFAPSAQVERVHTFLRWTKQISTTEFQVPPDRTVTHDVFARELLTALEDEAQKSADWWRQIASAIVKEGKVLVMTYNKHYQSAHTMEIDGDPRSNLDAGQGPGIYLSIHAEAWAIALAAKQGIVTDGADIYVTTFPCPTCARALVEAGFKRVFYKKGYSLLDAETILKAAGIEIILVAD
jgi:dCMP deaminase